MIPTQMSMRSNTQITDLDAPDGRTQNMENQQTLNNSAHNTMTNNNSSQSNSTIHPNPMTMRTTECNNRKISIPLNQSKRNNSNYNDDPEKRSMAGDPIYQTISSEKGAKSLRRNCISLENLRTLTIKNDLNSYGNNLLQNQIGQPQSQFFILPAFPPPPLNYHVPYFNPKPQLVYGPPPPPMHMIAQHLKANHRTPFANYGGYANPNPYSNLSNTNSRQSIGNESDDYRKYRDVAL